MTNFLPTRFHDDPEIERLPPRRAASIRLTTATRSQRERYLAPTLKSSHIAIRVDARKLRSDFVITLCPGAAAEYCPAFGISTSA
jgi:hypothetical protein